MTRCRGRTRATRSAPDRSAEPVLPTLEAGIGRHCASPSPAATSSAAPLPEALAALHRRRRRAGRHAGVSRCPDAARRPRRRLRHHRHRGGRPAPRAGCAPDPAAFDPAVRDRLLAGALVPAALVHVSPRPQDPPAVPATDDAGALFSDGGRDPRPRHALHGAPAWPADLRAGRRHRAAGARQSRRVHPADQLRRPARGGRAPVFGGRACRWACRSSPRHGGRMSRLRVARVHWSSDGRVRRQGHRKDGIDHGR